MASEHHIFAGGMAPDHHLSIHHPYSAAWSAPQTHQISVRQYPSTSSAFSPSAHPDEDWTKVSDLAERRRIQNRIAQRNYRKKIKERMAQLEARAGGGDGKPAATKKPSPKSKDTASRKANHQRRLSSPPVTTAAAVIPQHPFTPPMNPEDQPFFPSPSPPAASPPPFSAYQNTYSPPQSDNAYYTPVTTAGWMATAATTTAPTLPPMTHFTDAYTNTKSTTAAGNESMSSFAAYGDYTLGVPGHHPLAAYDSNPHVSSHHHHHHHQQPRLHHDLLPPVSSSSFPLGGGSSLHHDVVVSSSSSTSATTGPSGGHLAAPDSFGCRYPPPPPPSRA